MELRDDTSESRKQIVQTFYDSYGWKKDSSGHYQDEVDFEDSRLATYPYRSACHLRVKRFIQSEGDFLLDAASGPVQYPEYLEYSRGYRKRVCIDFSIAALREARHRLGEHGLYVLADITRLPFHSEVFDAFVSLHTIYHVPADEQADAFRELHRTLKCGRSGVVVYAWRRSPLFAAGRMLSSAIRSIKRAWLRQARAEPLVAPALYYEPHGWRWIVTTLKSHHIGFDIRSWRSVSVPFLQRYIPNCSLGRIVLKGIFWLEDQFPHLLGRVGTYPLIVIERRPQEKNMSER